jgi:hypothetical protein
LPVKLEVTPPTPKAPLSANNSSLREQKPVALKSQAIEAATTVVPLPTPKATLPVSNPNWQTKSVQERKTGGGRAYAFKQVDVFNTGDAEQHESFLASTPPNESPFQSFFERVTLTEQDGEQHTPFLAPTPGNDGRSEFFLDSAVTTSATRDRFGPFFGHTSATAVATVPFEALISGLQTAPSFLTPLHTTQKPDPIPRPVVKLPGMSSRPPALGDEQHPVNSVPKKVKRSTIKLVKPETPLQMLPTSPMPRARPDTNLVDTEVEQPPKLALPTETFKISATELAQPVATAAQPKTSQDTSNMLTVGTEPSTPATVEPSKMRAVVDGPSKLKILDPINEIASVSAKSTMEPVKLDQLRHRFIDTSVLKEAPTEKPQLKLLPELHPMSLEEVARDALVIAFHERESARVELSRNYSHACVEHFSEKAREYKARRKALASLMPSGNLSFEDEASFPYLSIKDTEEPVVCNDASSLAIRT